MKLNMIFKVAATVIFITTSSHTYSQSTKSTSSKFLRACQAYGFLKSQEYTLTNILKEVPELNLELIKAKSLFNSNFGIARVNIDSYLQEQFGSKIDKFQEETSQKLIQLLSGQVINKQTARAFLTEVENRSNGTISTPILETLLSFQYKDSPEREFQSNHVYNYNTKGHVKSKGTDWTIKVPKSWYKREGDRPNIIQTFISDYGSGSEMMLLIVKDLGFKKGQSLSKKEELDMFSEANIKAQLSSDSKFVYWKRMVLDNYNGVMYITEDKVERLDLKIKIRMLQYNFHRAGKVYFLQCLISGQENDDLETQMSKFLPLFRLVANSIVENQQYL